MVVDKTTNASISWIIAWRRALTDNEFSSNDFHYLVLAFRRFVQRSALSVKQNDCAKNGAISSNRTIPNVVWLIDSRNVNKECPKCVQRIPNRSLFMYLFRFAYHSANTLYLSYSRCSFEFKERKMHSVSLQRKRKSRISCSSCGSFIYKSSVP